jgi:NADH-quinone oxidoreductase subunit G
MKVVINGEEHNFTPGLTVIQACEIAGVEIPRFCYHDRLKIAGNCRMCLVEISPGPPKPQASCAINIAEGMIINTKSEMVIKAREGVMEFLLANHPLDCPICDQGGECDLQDQAFVYGKDTSNFHETKRSVEEKYMGPLIKTNMTRCIHCTRCVRFMEDIAGTGEIGTINRGNEMEITTFLNQGIKSELSGNIIDLCPVGALTAKPYSANYRPWELKRVNSIDVMDSLGSAISIHSKANEVIRILPRVNDEINEEWLSDKSRFACDGLLNQRLDKYYIRNSNGKLVPSNFTESFEMIVSQLSKINMKKEFAAITGDFTDAETVFALKSLMVMMGSPYMESRQKNYSLNLGKRENYIFNSKITGLDLADVLILVGTNTKIEAPVLNARIRRNILERKMEVFVIGEKCDLTYNYNYLGAEKSLLQSEEFKNILKQAKKPMLIAGLDAFAGTDGLSVHEVLLDISSKFLQQENWNGFNVLHKNSSSVAALDAKFIYEGGIDEILSKCKSKEIKVLYAVGADEIDTKNLTNTFIIYQGSHGDKLAEIANVILPSTAYSEKVATFINTEGLKQKTARAVLPKAEIMDDETLINHLAEKLNLKISPKIAPPNQVNAASPLIKTLEGVFTLAKTNFYMTDYITRNSATMAKALKELGS